MIIAPPRERDSKHIEGSVCFPRNRRMGSCRTLPKVCPLLVF